MKTVKQIKEDKNLLTVWNAVSAKAEQNRQARLAKEKRRAVRIELFHARMGSEVHVL